MQKYKNISGRSGVSRYEIGDDYVKVQFNDGSIYLYNYESAGKNNIEKMKQLALRGQGLNGYINSHVRDLYVK